MSGLIDGLKSLNKVQWLAGWVAQWSEFEGFEIFFHEESKLPAFSADSNCSVIFEGLLQNRADLITQLGNQPISPTNDAALIRLAFTNWDEDLICQLRGAFSLAIWDKRKNVLLYFRDHCGICPSFYARNGSQVIFSTSVGDIVRHPKMSVSLNRSAFVDFLCHRRPMPEETFYAQIKRVLPGHAVRFTEDSQQSKRYWYSNRPEGKADYITDLSESDFDETLERAIRRCVQIGYPGILLSGGLDSVSIASFLTDITKRGGARLPLAVSIGFHHPDFNEIDKQTSVARQLGLEHCLRHVDDIVAGRGLVRMALDLGQTWSQPMWSTWQPLFMAVSCKAKEMGCKVLLTGSGGDEWLNVSSHLMADLIRQLDFDGLNRTVKTFLSSYRIPKKSLLWHLLWKAGFRLILTEYARQLARQVAPDVLRNRIRKRIRGSTLSWVAGDPELKAAANDRIEILVEQYMNRVLPKEKYPFYSISGGDHFVDSITSLEMEQAYESSQRVGVTLLHPYFDPDLIHLLLRISPEVLQQGGMEKGIIRTVLAKRFPGLKFETQKKASAMNYWLSLITTEGRDLYYGNGGVKSLIEMGIVNGKEIGPTMDRAFAARTPFENAKIWDLLCLETWIRSHSN